MLDGISIYLHIQVLHFIFETWACTERPPKFVVKGFIQVIVKKVATWCPKKLVVMVISLSTSPCVETNKLSVFPFPSIIFVFDTTVILNRMWFSQVTLI